MNSFRNQFRNAMLTDGVDHINLHPFGETEIGRIASTDWCKRFFVPHVGGFISARSFANWMISGGDDSLRESTKFYKTNVPVRVVRSLMLFAKFYQLCSLRNTMIGSKELFGLPWVSYKKYASGVREHDRWENYGDTVKKIARTIIESGPKAKYDWLVNDPEILDVVNHYLEITAGADFVPFEVLDKPVKVAKPPKTKPQAVPDHAEVYQYQLDEGDQDVVVEETQRILMSPSCQLIAPVEPESTEA